MYTSNKDLESLHEAYSEIGRYEYLDTKRILLERELNDIVLEEGNILDAIGKGLSTVADTARGAKDKVEYAFDKAAEGVQDITSIPSQMTEYFNVSLPQFLEKLSSFLTTALISGATGAAITYVVGKLLLMLSKKLQQSDKDNEDIIVRMLPDEVAPHIEKIKNLKQSDPNEYRRQVFAINQKALKELRSALASRIKQNSSGVMQKILTFFGELLSSTAGSLLGGVVIAYLVQQLGFNPLPIFPTLP
jgi:hypothetical protein